MSGHAVLAPSASSRWMTCPGSVKMVQKAEEILGPEKQSDFSAAGSAAHALAERCLHNPMPPEGLMGKVIYTADTGIPYVVDQAMCDKVQPYLDYVRSLGGDLYIEQKVFAGKAMPDVYGTADAIVCHPGRLTLVDLKTGQGVKVDARDNTQLLIYMLGAVRAFDPMYDFDSFTMVISQPPLQHHSEWTITRNQLVDFAIELKRAVERIEKEPDTLSPSVDACRWCRARPFCPALKGAVEEAVDITVKGATMAELGFAMAQVPLVQAWITGVEDAVKELLLNGESVPGYKVVQGRSSRAWTDEAAALAYLKDRVVSFQKVMMTEPKLLTPAQAEKAIKTAKLKGEVDLDSLITTFAGKPTVAPDSDKREALVKGDRAASDFAEFA